MKRFNHDAEQSKVFDQYGAFFAFSEKQFDEGKKEGVKYASLGAGLICPSDNAEKLMESLNNAWQKKIDYELEHNSKKDIIWYELANHECQIVYSYDDAIGVLEPYGITEEDIKKEWQPYIDHCVANDYF